jgi:hypothetical protein
LKLRRTRWAAFLGKAEGETGSAKVGFTGLGAMPFVGYNNYIEQASENLKNVDANLSHSVWN